MATEKRTPAKPLCIRHLLIGAAPVAAATFFLTGITGVVSGMSSVFVYPRHGNKGRREMREETIYSLFAKAIRNGVRNLS